MKAGTYSRLVEIERLLAQTSTKLRKVLGWGTFSAERLEAITADVRRLDTILDHVRSAKLEAEEQLQAEVMQP